MTLVITRVLQGRPFIDCLMDTRRCERALKALMGGKVEPKCLTHSKHPLHESWKTPQCLGRSLGIMGQNPSLPTGLHVVMFQVFFINLRYIP